MIIIVDSLTGQSERFANKLDHPWIHILDVDEIDDEVLLITRSYDFGKITEDTAEFMDKYSDKVVGIAVSGNRNWGENYGRAGIDLSECYNIPLVLKFEGSGFRSDVEHVKQWILDNKKED